MGFLTTYFANPLLLAGAAAIAAPIIIWMVNRWRTKVVEWAAIEFLRRAVTKTSRRLRIEELLLLALRCLILILLATAFARPRGLTSLSGDGADARKSVVIVIDGSYSMGYQLGSEKKDTVFQRARSQAREIIGKLTRQDRLSVARLTDELRVLTDGPRVMDPAGRREAQRIVEDPEFGVSARGTSGAALMQGLPAILESFDPQGLEKSAAKVGVKTIFFLTDAQRSAFFQGDRLVDPSLALLAERIGKLGGELQIVDCSAKEPLNVAITKVATRDPIVGVGLPCRFDVTLRNDGREEARGLSVEYRIDNMDTPVKRVSVDLRAGEVRSLPPFPYEFRTPGPHRFQVRFSSDKLVIDNLRSLVVDVREAVGVLLVDGEPQTGSRRWEDEVFYLSRALNPFSGDDQARGLIRPKAIDEAQLGDQDLKDYDLVVVANVSSLADAAVSQLESYVRNGGAVLFTAGDRVNASFYNKRLFRDGAGLLPARLGEVAGRRGESATEDAPEWELELVDTAHPGVSLFAEEDMTKWLKMPPFYKIQKVEELGKGKLRSRVLVDFLPRAEREGKGPTKRGERSPALLEKRFGRGLSLLWLSSIDADWNKALVYDGFYVPFWYMLTLHLSQTGKVRRDLSIGEVFEDFLSDEEYIREVRITRPDGQPTVQAPQRIQGQERHRLSYENTAQPGLYGVEFVGAPAARNYAFAVNVDTGESRLDKVGVDELKEAFAGLKVKLVNSELLAEELGARGAGPGVNEYWRAALALVVLLLVAESLLAMWIGRRRR